MPPPSSPAQAGDPARATHLAASLLHRLPLTFAALLLLAAIAINFANVLARHVFLASIYWADEAMVFLVIWSIFLAGAAITFDRSHLTMDLFSMRLASRWRRPLQGVIAAVCLAIFAFMAWQAVIVVRTMLRNDQRSIALDLPMAIPHAALGIGFALMFLAVAARAAWGRGGRGIRQPIAPDDVTPAL
jgi:TRAP-type C4-dicarboxylate transport system permease small subunit